MNKEFLRAAELVTRIIPYVAREECFAMHGGTAINLFHSDLLRLSTDIDLTYIPLEDRKTSLDNINNALKRIARGCGESVKDSHFTLRSDTCKLLCSCRGTRVKIEVNMTKRGIAGGDVLVLPLCEKARKMFGLSAEARIVPTTLLYGGKIAAALSRQHPRDIFDVRYMRIPLEEAKTGFMLCLLGSDRPLYESFRPNLQDRRGAMKNQFEGMTDLPFTYDDFEETRSDLIAGVNAMMTDDDREFLLSFESARPVWDGTPYGAFRNYPSVRWKLLNLEKLSGTNPRKLALGVRRLADVFSANPAAPFGRP